MKRKSIVSVSALAASGLALLPASAIGQQTSLEHELVGTWTLVSFQNVAPDGTKRPLMGDNPKGVLILEADGRYAQMEVRADRPKFKADTRLGGTPEENKAALAGSYAAFGTWSINEADKTLVRHIDGSLSYPNEEGRDSKWLVTLNGNELETVVPVPAAGGRTELIWRRAR